MNNANYINQHGYSLHPEFHQFMISSVVPATGLDVDEFWKIFTTTLSASKSVSTGACADHQINEAQMDIPIGKLTVNTINSRWGSMYDALYQEEIIPHCAGLKPGNGSNHARRDRVIRCAKDFLDRAFPLREGSHRDAVSYMVYFQNLLVILADGSTTGLQKPRQFAGKNGPTNEPESILLKHSGMHAELIFDRNGKVGEHDLANIDDIQLEAANHTLLNFTSSSVSEKCDTYRTWLELVEGGLSDKTFTGSDGEVLVLDHNNWAIKLSDQNTECELIIDQQGQCVPNAAIDALTAALIYSNGRQGAAHLNMVVTDRDAGVNEELFAQFGKLLTQSKSTTRQTPMAATPAACIKVLSASADNLPDIKTISPNNSVPGHDHVVIGAMECHGYDVRQAITN